MNMLSSLKALLFSSTAARSPLEGAGASPAPTTDFAQMLSGSIVDAGQALPAVAVDAPLDAPVDTPVQPQEEAIEGEQGSKAVWRNADSPFPPGLALGLVRHAADTEASPSNGRAGAVENAAPEMPPPEPSKALKRGKPSPQEAELEAPDKPLEADAPTVAAEPRRPEDDNKAESAGEHVAIEPPAVPAMPVVALVTEPAPAPPPVEGKASKAATKPRAGVIAMPVGQPKPASGDLPTTQEPPARPVALPDRPPPQLGARRPDMPQSVVRRSDPISGEDAPAPILVGDPVPVTPAPVLNGKPVKAEAIALLQLVREQVEGRQSGTPVRAEQVSAAASPRHEQPAPIAEAALAAPTPITFDAPPQPAPQQHGVTQAPSAAPQVDLSASIGAQVVDMGVSGQWIDGLARDIAGLSANGAQGRFQLNTHQLGSVQVDIRQGSDGAAVNLTVATEAAEMALRHDSERLKLDASLSAVRIAEVKIERAAPVAEAARTDAAGQQSSQQQSQHSSSQAQSAWQNGGQDMSQPQGQQGRWQPRQNNGFDPKSAGDPAVLNHGQAQDGASETARARYA